MATEYEWKFKATPAVLSAISGAFSGNWKRISMETTYFDTPSGTLSAKHYTLRRRLENGVPVCTLKAPTENCRGEWETECDGIDTAVPKLLMLGCPENLPTLIKEGLIPVCGAKFTRLAKEISLPEGIVELALDEGILTGGSRQAPLCEVEVELKSGDCALCDAFAQALAEQYQLQAEEKSKFRRALALYKGE